MGSVVFNGDEVLEEFDAYYVVESGNLTDGWNQAYREWMDSSCEYLVISNNDVVFTHGWLNPLLDIFEQYQECGISAPMTNQPGHQHNQLLPINDPVHFIEHSKAQKTTGAGYQIDFVNGFCFCLRKDRIVPYGDGVLFNPKITDYGNEDEYQSRMRERGLVAYAMEDSRVFHFKDVSMESWKNDRIPLDMLPKRLKV